MVRYSRNFWRWYVVWDWRVVEEVRRLKGRGMVGISLMKMDGVGFFVGGFGCELHVNLKRAYQGRWAGKVGSF